MKMILLFLMVSMATGPMALAAVRPEKIKASELNKTQSYIRDGLVVGGDRAVDHVMIKDIRHAKNGEFERIVLDVEGTVSGTPTALPRPPFFQVAVNGAEKRLVVTVFGSPKLGFDPKKVLKEFQKSRVVSDIELFPKLEEQSWTFAINFKRAPAVEVFELQQPLRIIVDLEAGKQ